MKGCNGLPIAVLCTVLLLLTFDLQGQVLTQHIRGEVRDKDSQSPLPGATVVIEGSIPVTGTVTGADGKFILKNVPVGRYNLKITYIGFEPALVTEVSVESGKEVVLNIDLKESAVALDNVEVKAYASKDRAVNAMAMISSRQLTMEEASRYAGGIDDPARLATAFAGVTGSLSSNAIVIRGNAPKGLLWRMEGIEIPNPSHFANVSTFGGGGITALSSQMLSTSDFYTGAFPAEFGNALSGVFDMKIRNGNNENREHTIKAGIIGLDFASEGPFAKGKRASYLVNYRYSTLALISPLLPENARGIRYQDLSFKFNFPLKKSGTISLWGLYSSDRTGSEIESDSLQWQYYQDMEQDENKNSMGVAGLNHKVIISDRTYLNTAAAVTGNLISWQRQRLNNTMELNPQDQILQKDRKYTLSFLVNHKFGRNHTNRSGINYNILTYRIIVRKNKENTGLESIADAQGSSSLLQVYSQSKIDISPGFTLNAGLHSQWLSLNRSAVFEPRAGLEWAFTEKMNLSLAYGMHSRMEPTGFYFAAPETDKGVTSPNKKLGLTQAHHWILSYEINTGEYSRIRIEPYYQKLFNVPVVENSSFSMINLEMDWFFNDSLVNRGTGKNLGIDLTGERFLSNGYYYLVTASLFDSKYTGGDAIERDTRFNKNFVVNFLAGKEWSTGRKGNHVFGLNGKFSVLGGDRITPVNQEASSLLNDVVYDDLHAFEDRKPHVFYLDLTATWKTNKAGYSSTWSLQFVNLLFQKEFYGHRYNFREDRVEPLKEIVVIPNISYRIDF